MKKMKRDTDGRPGGVGGESSGPGGMPGGMPAGAGFDIGSILGAMGGMGGGGGDAGSPGAPGGFDIGSILGAMGGQPPSEGGSSSGGAASGMGDILGKLMNNPKAQAVFQKAQSNPKVGSRRGITVFALLPTAQTSATKQASSARGSSKWMGGEGEEGEMCNIERRGKGCGCCERP